MLCGVVVIFDILSIILVDIRHQESMPHVTKSMLQRYAFKILVDELDG